MMKAITYIVSLILGSLRGHETNPQELTNYVFEQLKDMLGFIALSLTGLVLTIIGLLTAYFNVLIQYDKTNEFSLGALTIGSIALSLVGIGLIFYSSRTSQPEKAKKMEEPIPRAPSPLEQALAALVLDFVQEREKARTQPSAIQRVQQPVADDPKTGP